MYNYFNNQAQQVVRVNGEDGARAYVLPPNSSALLLDDTAPIIWLAQTDGAGYKTVSAYEITPKKTTTLEERILRLERSVYNDKPDSPKNDE